MGPTGPTTLQIPPDAVVVLDVDDTLYLERSYVRSGFAAVGRLLAAERGVEGVGATLWDGFVAGVRGDAFDRALVANGLEPDPELIARLVDRYRSHHPEIELLPDAARLVAGLASRPTAVITDGPADSQRAKVAALGLEGTIGTIIVTSELGIGYSKPHPLPYRQVEDAHGAAPARCWYVGDNPSKDFITPVERGWTPVRIRRRLSLHEGVETPEAVHEIVSLDQLVVQA